MSGQSGVLAASTVIHQLSKAVGNCFLKDFRPGCKTKTRCRKEKILV